MDPTQTEEIPHHQAENPYNYTKIQLARRTKDVKELEKHYPSLPPSWLDMVWDYCENTDPEELQRVIESGQFEGPSQFSLNRTIKEVAEANEKNKSCEEVNECSEHVQSLH